MKKLIFGFVGQIASGKGTAVEYLKQKHGASTYRFSTMLRDILDRLYLPQSRHNMQTISTALRTNFGEDMMSNVMIQDVSKDDNRLIAIDGIRRPSDASKLKKIPGFVLVHITADIEKRYERIIKRGENSDDTKKTFEEFEKDHTREAEEKIAEIAEQAEETIDNNGPMENLHNQLDKLYNQLDRLVEKYDNQS